MSRPRLGRQPSVPVPVRLPLELAMQFERECKAAGETKSEVLRRLVIGWLRRRQEISRLKTKETSK